MQDSVKTNEIRRLIALLINEGIDFKTIAIEFQKSRKESKVFNLRNYHERSEDTEEYWKKSIFLAKGGVLHLLLESLCKDKLRIRKLELVVPENSISIDSPSKYKIIASFNIFGKKINVLETNETDSILPIETKYDFVKISDNSYEIISSGTTNSLALTEKMVKLRSKQRKNNIDNDKLFKSLLRRTRSSFGYFDDMPF